VTHSHFPTSSLNRSVSILSAAFCCTLAQTCCEWHVHISPINTRPSLFKATGQPARCGDLQPANPAEMSATAALLPATQLDADLWSAEAEASGLLVKTTTKPVWHTTLWWRVIHALGFFIGGSTFIAGTACYYAPPSDAINTLAAVLYTIGSLGFLSVDVLEFLTFKECPLRANISLSAIGSTFYVIGSVGFLPSIMTVTTAVGVWGFIIGSAFIGCSQAWKVVRLAYGDEGRPALKTLVANRDVFTATGVEFNAGVGAWCFFVGTAMYAHATDPSGWMNAILGIWMAGSVFFTLGALFLCSRHFVLGLS